MAFWVSRIVFKSGEMATERELRLDENHFDGPTPEVGGTLIVRYRGRELEAEVINRREAIDKINPDWLRVAEVYRSFLGRRKLAKMDPDAGYEALERWRAMDQEEREAGGIFRLMSSRKQIDR